MLGQIEGAQQVIESAAGHGWEAALLAIIVIVMLSGFGILLNKLWAVNTRLGDRVTQLESKIEDKLMTIVSDTAKALTMNAEVMRRTTIALEKVEIAVHESHEDQHQLMEIWKASPCLMSGAFSEETQERLKAARDAAIKPREKPQAKK